jgi:hypothetical protein
MRVLVFSLVCLYNLTQMFYEIVAHDQVADGAELSAGY